MKVFSVHEVLAATQKKLRDTEAERDALAAKVYEQKHFIESVMANIGAGATLDEVVDMLCNWWDSYKLPQQCLRDMQAEAGRAGYYEGFRAGIVIDAPLLPPQSGASAIDHFRRMVDHAARVNADNYAESVRKGGE